MPPISEHSPMAPPSPPSQSPTGDDSSEYYYLVVAIGAIAVLLLVSNVIAVGCCSQCYLVEAIRRVFRSRGVLTNGLEDVVPQRTPVLKYQKEQDQGNASENECSVCLSVFMDGEDVRQLPRCKHSFHAPCIDMWLYSHSNCPLCRATVLALPLHCSGAADGEDSRQRRPLESIGLAGLVVALV